MDKVPMSWWIRALLPEEFDDVPYYTRCLRRYLSDVIHRERHNPAKRTVRLVRKYGRGYQRHL